MASLAAFAHSLVVVPIRPDVSPTTARHILTHRYAARAVCAACGVCGVRCVRRVVLRRVVLFMWSGAVWVRS